MKNTVLFAALLGLTTISQASEELATANNCLACHKTDTQLVGPSYQDVAAKYKGQDGAADILYESIKNGASGKWGAIPMPANAACQRRRYSSLGGLDPGNVVFPGTFVSAKESKIIYF